MPSDIKSILALEVPIIVLLGERSLRVAEVVALAPGSIIELPKAAEEELSLQVNNKAVGTGVAVKVGENFGMRITHIGDIQERIQALGSGAGKKHGSEDDAAAAMAAAMLAGS